MSKFSGLFEEAKKDKSEPIAVPVKVKTSQKKDGTQPEYKSKIRVKGRRSDPNYTGAFAYIPAQLHEDVRRELFGRKNTDFSGLVEDLLTDWLSKQKKIKK